MNHSTWDEDNCSAGQSILHLLWNEKFVTIVRNTQHWCLAWAGWIQSFLIYYSLKIKFNIEEFCVLEYNAVLSIESQPMFHSWAVLSTCIMLVSCIACSLTLKMEDTCSSEMLADSHQTTWCFSPEGRLLHNHFYENLKSYKFNIFFPPMSRSLCQSFNVVLLFIFYIALLFKLNFSVVNACCAFILFLPGVFSLISQPLNFYLCELSPLTAD
jgi:hypothetical protein